MTRHRWFVFFAVVGLVACASIARAQPGATKSYVMSNAIKQTWQEVRLNIKESADQMPESDYGFRPTPEVRTFGQILAHVAGMNYAFCAAARGEKSPHAEDELEKTAKTKAQIVKGLNDSLAYCDTAYNALTDARAVELVTQPFGTGQGARALPLLSNTAHLNEHYGNLVTYFRLRRIVPPSTRRETQQR